MTAIKRFLFEYSFDSEPEVEQEELDIEEQEPEIVVPTFSEEELAQAREESFAAGKQEGFAEASGSTDRIAAQALEKIQELIPTLFAAQETANTEMHQQSIMVGVSVIRKLFPSLNQEYAAEEVSRVVNQVMETLRDEPKVVIAVNGEIMTALKERMTGLAIGNVSAGKVVLVEDETIPIGDCRIEWESGGAGRDTAALWQEIDAIVAHNMPFGQLLGPLEPEQPADTDETGPQEGDGAAEAPVTAEPGETEASPVTADATHMVSDDTVEDGAEQAPEDSVATPAEDAFDALTGDSEEVSTETEEAIDADQPGEATDAPQEPETPQEPESGEIQDPPTEQAPDAIEDVSSEKIQGDEIPETMDDMQDVTEPTEADPLPELSSEASDDVDNAVEDTEDALASGPDPVDEVTDQPSDTETDADPATDGDETV